MSGGKVIKMTFVEPEGKVEVSVSLVDVEGSTM